MVYILKVCEHLEAFKVTQTLLLIKVPELDGVQPNKLERVESLGVEQHTEYSSYSSVTVCALSAGMRSAAAAPTPTRAAMVGPTSSGLGFLLSIL